MSFSTKTAFNTKIGIPFGELQSIIDWCETNCKYPWGYSSSGEMAGRGETFKHYYNFYFESEKDYVAFIVWKQ